MTTSSLPGETSSVEARHRLTLQEQRLMQWVISNIEPTDTEFQTYRVNIKELAETIGITNKDFYDRMRQTTKKVMRRVIEIEEGEQLLQIPLINRAVYHKRSGTMDVRIDEHLKQYLLQLRDNFTSVRLKYVFRLSSTYSIRIYELLCNISRSDAVR